MRSTLSWTVLWTVVFVLSCENGVEGDVEVGTSDPGTVRTSTRSPATSGFSEQTATGVFAVDQETTLTAGGSELVIAAETFAAETEVTLTEKAEGVVQVKAVNPISGEVVVPLVPVEYCLKTVSPDRNNLLFDPNTSAIAVISDDELDEATIEADESFVVSQTYSKTDRVCGATAFANGVIEVVEKPAKEEQKTVESHPSDYQISGASWTYETDTEGAKIARVAYVNTEKVTVVLNPERDDVKSFYVTSNSNCRKGGKWKKLKKFKNGFPWTLKKLNDTNEVYVKYRKNRKDQTPCLVSKLIHDDVAPTSPALTLATETTNTATVNLTLSAVGADQMYITNTAECSDGGSWVDYTTAVTGHTLGQTNAVATVYGKFRDAAGNETTCVSDSVVHDNVAPSNVSLVIDGGNQTASTSVHLTLAATDALDMYITNVAECGSGGSWETYATSRSWVLAQANGTASVYAKFRDSLGNESECIHDTIIHDNVAPLSPSLVISGGDATSDSAPDLTLSATGAQDMYVTNTSGCASGGSWETYVASKSNWSLAQNNGTATVFVKFRDAAQNETSCVSDTITHDDTAPTSPSLLISSGAVAVTSSSTSLALSAADASEMYVTNTAGCASGGSWENYGTSKAGWTLAQTNSTATVYVKFRDAAQNETACVSDTIVHDNTAPTDPGSFVDGSHTSSSSQSPSLSWSASSDGGSGVASYEISIGSTSGATDVQTWTSVGNVTNATVTGLSLTAGQTYYANIRSLDSAGNTSDPVNGDGFSVNPSIAQITSGRTHRCVRFSNNTVKCWGYNNHGSLGLGVTHQKGDGANEMGSNLVAADLSSSLTPAEIYSGGNHNCVRFTDNTVKCWGMNSSGELGLDSTTNRGDGASEMGDNLPLVNLGTSRTAQSLELGHNHTCAILDTGDVKCWGWNAQGGLGQGNTTILGDGSGEMASLAAVSLGTNRTAVEVSAGLTHTCARLDNNTMKCWGRNSAGQAGQGTNTDIGDDGSEMGDNLSAIDLGTNRTPLEITTGDNFTCARLDNGQVKCWGVNNYGQLGQGNTDILGNEANEMGDNLTAIDLGTNRTAQEIDSSGGFSCARLDNNQVKCWGRNNSGQLGQGHTNSLGDGGSEMGDNLTAIDLGTSRTATAISLGEYSACALLDTGDLKCWGQNSNGELGQGDITFRGDGGSEMGDNLPTVEVQ